MASRASSNPTAGTQSLTQFTWCWTSNLSLVHGERPTYRHSWPYHTIQYSFSFRQRIYKSVCKEKRASEDNTNKKHCLLRKSVHPWGVRVIWNSWIWKDRESGQMDIICGKWKHWVWNPKGTTPWKRYSTSHRAVAASSVTISLTSTTLLTVPTHLLHLLQAFIKANMKTVLLDHFTEKHTM